MSIAEKLREAAAKRTTCGNVDRIALALTSEPARCDGNCRECTKKWYGKLADAIEAEINASKPAQLPEGVIWPRFKDGQPVNFGDEFVNQDGVTEKVTGFFFYEDKVFVNPSDRYSYGETVKRPEPEVLDADGVPIKVGDTVWYEIAKEPLFVDCIDPSGSLDLTYEKGGWGGYACVPPDKVTHRKRDTQEAIDTDAMLLVSESFFDQRRDEFEDRVFDLLRRQRKLLGGGQ